MLADRMARGLLPRRLRLDHASRAGVLSSSATTHVALVATIALGFLIAGGAWPEPSDLEARLGLAAAEPLGPYGEVFGGYDPSLAPGVVLLGRIVTILDGGTATTDAIRWPATLAAIGFGLLLARRVASVLGSRASVFAALAAMGSIGLMERSSSLMGDALAGFAVVAAIDRALTYGSRWGSGLLAAMAWAFGGWPALAMIVVPLLAIGRPGSSASLKLLLPPIILFAGWSAWALSAARLEVWVATLTFPLTGASSWSLGPWVVAAGLPWSPIAAVVALPTFRESWSPSTRRLVFDWLKVAAVGVMAGSFVPGMAAAGSFLIAAGLVVASASVLDRAWSGAIASAPRWMALAISVVIGLAVGGVAVYAGSYLAAAQPYYRGVGIVAIGVGLALLLVTVDSGWTGASRGVVRSLLLAAIAAKVLHAGFRVPEANYRFGKGPWGRAVAQHLPPGYPLYVFHSIAPSLAFATEHPVRQLRTADYLTVQPGDGPKFVLVTESEFEHWPTDAPKVRKVRAFQDEFGGVRILARTFGPLTRIDVD